MLWEVVQTSESDGGDVWLCGIVAIELAALKR